MNDFFYCYSPNLFDYLRRNGIRYICAGLNESTMRKFWQFKRDAKLDALLTDWHANKPV